MNNIMKYIFFAAIILLSYNFLSAQNKNITGFIFDKDNQPLNGANVIISGTNFGAASDINGYFEIKNIPFGIYDLEISVIGFKKEKIRNIKFYELFEPLRITLRPESVETDQIIVSAGKYEQRISDITVSSVVIGPEIFSKKNIVQLDEALRYVPGVSVALEQVSIRGSSGYSKGAGTRVFVAVDGIPIYTGDTGEIVWEMVPITDVERIEIIKGPASSLYGSTAIGGVINIITKKAASEPVTYIKTFAGVYDDPSYDEWKWNKSKRTFFGVEAVHSSRLNNLGYTFSIKRFDNDSYRENDFKKRLSGYLKLDYDIDVNKSITFIGNYLDMNRGNFIYWKDSRNALIPKDSDRDQTVKSDRQFASLIYKQKFSDTFSGEFKSSYYRSNFEGIGIELTTATSNLFRNELITTSKINDKFVIVSGVEVSYADVKSNLFSSPYFLSASAYVHSEYKFSDKINSTLGLRYDFIKLDTLAGANALTPRAGLNYKYSDELIFRTSFATGFRAPTPAEVFTSADAGSGIMVVENPNLDYETSLSFEIGAIYQPVNFIKFDAAFFNTDYNNFIEPLLTSEGNIQFVNLPKARIQGVDFTTDLILIPGLLNFSVGYNYLWARDINNNKAMKYRPRNTVYSSLEFTPYSFEFRTDLRYWSKVEEIDFNLTKPPINLIADGENRAEVIVVDLSIGYNFVIGASPFKIYLNGKNIFNYNYVEFIGNLSPIRNFSLSLETYF